jgi:hypothetical protein
MKPSITLLAVLLVTLGAAPTTSHPQLAFVEQSPPAARSLSLDPQSGFSPAPVPDQTIEAPNQHAFGGRRTELMPELFRQRKTYQGDGYTPGSTVQGEQQKRQKPLPGFNLSVPLE